jgi:hypothetical protein
MADMGREDVSPDIRRDDAAVRQARIGRGWQRRALAAEAEVERLRDGVEQMMNTADEYVYRLGSHLLKGGSFDDWNAQERDADAS